MSLSRGATETHPNELLARRVWQAVSRADAEELATLVAPDVVWHATTRHPWQGDHGGVEGAFAFLARIGESVDVFDATLEDILVSDARAMVLFHVSARRGTRRLEASYLMMARVEKARFAEIWTASLDPRAVEDFWADLRVTH